MKNNIVFVFVSFIFMMVDRNLIAWGAVVALGMDILIGRLHPNVVIKWIFGFALAA